MSGLIQRFMQYQNANAAIYIVKTATLSREFETEMKAKLGEHLPRCVYGFLSAGVEHSMYDHQSKQTQTTLFQRLFQRAKKDKELAIAKIESEFKADNKITPNTAQIEKPENPRNEYFTGKIVTDHNAIFGTHSFNFSFKAMAYFSNMALRKPYNHLDNNEADKKFSLWLSSQPDINHRKININDFIYDNDGSNTKTLIPKLFKSPQTLGLGTQSVDIYPYSVRRADEIKMNEQYLDITTMFVEPNDDVALSAMSDNTISQTFNSNSRDQQNNSDFYGELKAVAPDLQDAIDAYDAINVSLKFSTFLKSMRNQEIEKSVFFIFLISQATEKSGNILNPELLTKINSFVYSGY